ncbi:hypothetical protein BN8_05068 [Fibrisoma limi BUZ 3]|uniref:Uncharacterized protein n=1 Tax=Fibrisoma limi BUZ 3 TaxID=1185876 RepID=I2GPF3_9BACT|nr:hypothetical protein BN8_05068 [Fibrisoma limi BUZ 3]
MAAPVMHFIESPEIISRVCYKEASLLAPWAFIEKNAV